MGSAGVFPVENTERIQAALAYINIKLLILVMSSILLECIGITDTKRGIKPVSRVHAQRVRTLVQLQHCHVFRRNTVGRVAPPGYAAQWVILVTVALLEGASRFRRILVLVHRLHQHRAEAPGVKRIDVRLVQVRLLGVGVDQPTTNLCLS